MVTKIQHALFILISWNGASRPRAAVELTSHPFKQEPDPGSLLPEPLRDRLRPW